MSEFVHLSSDWLDKAKERGWISSEQAKKHDEKNYTNDCQHSKKLSDAYVVFLSLFADFKRIILAY